MWRIEERGCFCPSSDMQTQNMWCPPRAWHFCRGREGRGGGRVGQIQSLNANGGHATRWDAAAHRTSRRPSPLCPPTSLNAAVSPSAGRLMGCRGSSAAAQQHKFSSSSINSVVRSARRKRRLSTNLASQGPRDCCGVAWESPDRRSMPACHAGGAVPLSRGLQRPRDPR
jgi:hypothetical protein